MQSTETKWYQLDTQDILSRLETTQDGLSVQESQERQKQYGLNTLPSEKRFRLGLFLLNQLKSPLVYILLLGGFISVGIGHKLDAIIIFTAVVVNIGIGFYQEYSSGKTLEKLIRIVKVVARVKRGGELCEIDSEKLVPGDIVSVKAGMKVPADARLLLVKNLQTNEALLTGESASVHKDIDTISDDVTVGDRKNMIFTGSIVEKGDGVAIVVKTGALTEVGKIAALTSGAGEEETPLQQRLGHLGKVIAIIVSISSLVIIGVGLLENLEFSEIFITAIAVAVAAIPEGLPASIAVILAVSSKRILKKNGLIRQLIAAESLGSTSVICTDKTGTLTEGVMKVDHIIGNTDRKEFYASMALANEAILEKEAEGGFVVRGESTDQAKMHAFLDNDERTLNELLTTMPRLNLLPFDPEYDFIASFHALGNGKVRAYITGAPETLMSHSTLDENERAHTKEQYEKAAKSGLRMIAVAWIDIDVKDEEAKQYDEKTMIGLVKNITFGGLAAIKDPVRAGVKEVIGEIREAGIRVVMLTGDHKLTALAVGGELELSTDPHSVMEGEGLDTMSDEQLQGRIRDIVIFARVNPEHKLRIAKAWKAVGESVAMTGDGINDAPALKAADVGIAVGSGTDVTKEAADLILLDNSFITIVEAIKQGRTAFDNIRKVTVFLLSNSFSELILILGALTMRMPLPMVAVQILWINLAEDGLPNLALAFEPSEDDVLKRKPIQRDNPLLDKKAAFIAYPMGIMTDIVLFGVFFWLWGDGTHYSIEYVRTIIFAALGTDSLFFIFALKSLDRTVFRINPFNNIYLLVAIGAGLVMIFSAVYIPFLNTILQTVPLQPIHLLLVLGVGVGKLFLIELVKLLYRSIGTGPDVLERWISKHKGLMRLGNGIFLIGLGIFMLRSLPLIGF